MYPTERKFWLAIAEEMYALFLKFELLLGLSLPGQGISELLFSPILINDESLRLFLKSIPSSPKKNLAQNIH